MYRALIICNSRFPESRGALSDLHGPKKDGFLLRDVLTDHTTGMFDKSEVRNLNEAESREVASAVEQFFRDAEPDDTLVFYYSGHGRTRNQQLFLCAQDTDVDKPYSTAIPGGMLKDIVAGSLAQVKILILDCCFSAMFKGSEIADEFAGTGRYVIAATSATERASDGQLRGLPSPFTEALADALHSRAEDRDGDGLVDLDDVYSYLDTVSFAGARPHRKFDGAGAVPIARRAIRQPGNNARQDSPSDSPLPERLPVGDDAAIYALESAQPDLPYLDRTISGASFSQSRIDSFRSQMRSDLLEKMPAKLPAAEFLKQAGLMRHGRLTYTGLLLFGENPTTYLPAAVVQCVRFHGTTMTAPLETIDIQGSVSELIVKARDFIATLARTGELPTTGGAYAEAAYRYPMIAVREIIANAVVHRDYSDQESCVQIHAFDDRIEIISPGKWGGAPATELEERPIGQLERRSQKRNFRLAQTLTWSKLVEGVGAGVPRSIADCESTGTPEPVVTTDERMVQVTIFPRPYSKPTWVQPVPPPAAVQLARRLRQLRQQHWPEARLTQNMLAKAFSTEERLAPATVSSWESTSSPKLPPPHRLRAYARFFATPRSVEKSLALLPFEALTSDEQAACKKLESELLMLRSLAAEGPADEEITFTRSWHFTDSGRITLVCAELPSDQTGPLATPSNPNYTELQRFADLDAVVELYGHIRAENPLMAVHLRIPSEVGIDDLTGHIVLVGGVVWNEVTNRLSQMVGLPIRQVAHPELDTGEIFLAEVDGKEQEFWPQWIDAERTVLAQDVGLLARVPNPLNSSRTLTICNGIHSRGVCGAARSLTDEQLRDANERYISANFGNSASFTILMSVGVIKNTTITPDLSMPGVVLYQWPQGSTSLSPDPASGFGLP